MLFTLSLNSLYPSLTCLTRGTLGIKDELKLAAANLLQSCLTLCDPLVDCSPPVSSVHGILQAGVLEWVTIAFSHKLQNEPLIFFIHTGSLLRVKECY